MDFSCQQKELIENFFWFVNERHSIYIKKSNGFSRPWTKDNILATKKFCNIYRELDKGTVWYIDNIVKPILEEKANNWHLELLFQTIQYRFINTVKIMDELGGPVKMWDFDKISFENKIRNINSVIPFNTAYAICLTFSQYPNASDMHNGLALILNDIKNDICKITADLLSANNLESACNALSSRRGIGKFLAYEIACDLMYSGFLPFTENDYVNPGPGSLVGLKIIFGETLKTPPKRLIEELCLSQSSFLPPGFPGVPLTLRGVEHSLCEWRKYWNIKNGKNNGKIYKLSNNAQLNI